MPTLAIERLQYLLEHIPQRLRTIAENDFCRKESPEKWSKKEILGHLTDSAANNHHRFIRACYEQDPLIVYNQDEWNRLSVHQSMSSTHVIDFWELYNRHLLHILVFMEEENLSRTCKTGAEPKTIDWLAHDYVRHLEHHLKQILEY
jgi:hypothetical protein